MLVAIAILSLGPVQQISFAVEKNVPASPDDIAELFATTLPSSVGSNVSVDEIRGDLATVFVFLSTECPISNGYLTTIQKLSNQFRSQGISVIGINSNSGQSLRQIQLHSREYKIEFPCLKDAGSRFAATLRIKVCPEVCVIDRQHHVVYQGRIDDRYSRRGGAATITRSHDLESVLRAIVSRQKPTASQTEAIGCPIDFGRVPEPKTKVDPSAPTFTRDVAPILQSHCQECHRPGGIGPFELMNYKQALNWSDDIVEFTRNRTMPPWKASHELNLFANQRSLSEQQIQILKKWREHGCIEGNPMDAPATRKFTNGWRMGTPDLVLEPSEEFELAADGPDDYRCFVLPTSLDSDKHVVAMEILPGNAQVVHHVLVFLDSTGEAERLDSEAAGPGYSTAGGFPGFLPTGGLGGWAPGNSRGRLPDGMAKVLPRNVRVVMQVHYHRTGKAERDRTKLGLYFAKEPINRAVFGLALMPPTGPFGGMKIPAGASDYAVQTAFVLPTDVIALSVTPHMHLLGKDMKIVAKFPDNTERRLIDMTQWDFNWQETYQYREPIELPKGTRLEMIAHFDNSERNAANPHRPPQMVKWGPGTNDEMCIAFFELVPTKKASSPNELREPSPPERINFLLEGRRMAGEPGGLPDPKFFKALLNGENPFRQNRR